MQLKSLPKLLRMRIRSGSVAKPLQHGDKKLENLKSDFGPLYGLKKHEDKMAAEQPRVLETVQKLIYEAMHIQNVDSSDAALSQLQEEYHKLDLRNQQQVLYLLATKYGLDRAKVKTLMRHYLSLPHGEEGDNKGAQEGTFTMLYRTEQTLRSVLTPPSAILFKRIHWQPGGLKFLVDLRADLRAAIEEQNLAPLRALDVELKEILETVLSPAGLELHQITWNDPALLLEKIVAYEAVHPISNLYDLKCRLGSGRRCFGYFHPSIPGEPLIFIEVALTKTILDSIQELLCDKPPIPEIEATTALFYSISSTQPGLAGINLGKFLIKRVVRLLQQEIPSVQTFATLSPIPGFMSWLLSKLASQEKLSAPDAGQSEGNMGDAGDLRENFLSPWEEYILLEASGDIAKDCNALVLLLNLLTSPMHEWTKSEQIQKALKPILLRLCARYLLKEKKRGKALDAVTNFHAQNGAIVGRLNWMGDRSEHGLIQSAGIMVNYVYRLDKLEDYSRQYFDKGLIAASQEVEEKLIPLSGKARL